MQKMLAVGIDLGTTYSCVAVWKDGKIETIKNSDNERTTPSFVTFNKNGERQIGREAKNKSSKDPSNTVYDVKRLIGRKFHERQVKKDMEQWPFTVVDRDNIPMIQVLGKEEFKPEVISSMVLKKLKETVEERYDKKVEKAVITVPAYFNNAQRQATKVAGELAGLSVLRILNEPTAAALAYGINCDINSKKTVLIFDMGGGTTDVTVLTITKNEKKKFKVLSTAGDIHLGGEDFDKKIVDYICQDIKEKYKKDIKDNRKILRNLRSTTKESNEQEIEKKIKDNLKVLTQIKIAAVRAKEKLSNSTEIEIEIDGAFINNDEDYSKILSRTKFEALCDNLFNYAMKPVKKAIRNAGIDKKQIDEIVLVGGSTRIPKIQSMLKQYFGCKHLYKNIDPDEAVAHGAAIQAAMLLDPEFSKKIDLIDVTTHCLGTSISNGNDERKKMSVIIKKNTEIPCEKSDIFHTCNDNQTSITVDIWEGDGEYIEDNNLLGDYELTGLEPAPAGDKRVEISFKIDANGILDVTAKEIGAGECNSITVSNVKISTSHLEMKKLSENLQKYDDLDREKKKKIEVRHQLQEYIASLKALVDEKNSDLEEDECKKMRKMIDETTIWLKKVELTADRETLENKLNKMKEFFAPIFNERQTKRIIAKNDLLAHARTMKSAVEESSKIMIDICDKSIEEFENSPLVNTEQYECKLNKARSMLKLFVEKKHSDVIEKRGELLAIVLKLKQLVQEDFCKLSKDQKDFIIKTCDETMVWWDLTDFSTKIEKYDEKIHEVLNTWFLLKNEKRKYNSTIQKQSFKKQKLKDCVVLLENKKT